MHTSILASCRLFHNGDYTGCMYLREEDGTSERGIIVSHKTLEAALSTYPDSTLLTFEGPDEEEHSIYDVTRSPDFDTIVEGPWTLRQIRVAREDVARLVLWRRTRCLTSVLESLDVTDLKRVNLEEALSMLDNTLATIEHWTQPQQ